MAIPLELVVNPLSFGQVSTSLLRELYNRKQECLLHVTQNQFDLSSQEKDEDFEDWLRFSRTNFLQKHDRNNRIFKLWHLNGGMESQSKEQVLLSFYELDEPTTEEVNIVKNNHKVLFTSEETVKTFRDAGCENVYYIPLGFDHQNFKEINKNYYQDDRIVFTVTGKFEKRKNHEKIVKAWLKRFGNDENYALHCACWNPFLSKEQNNAVMASLMGGQKYFNVVLTAFMQTNKQYNDFLNSSHIILGMSGGEGWGLPEFQSVAMGKHSVILDCSGYKGWATAENSVLVKPSDKIPVYDDVFFQKGAPFNQGNIYDFHEEAFIAGCEEAIERVKSNKVNEEGRKLKEKFTYPKMLDNILEHLK